jgi:hypothetical protein
MEEGAVGEWPFEETPNLGVFSSRELGVRIWLVARTAPPDE